MAYALGACLVIPQASGGRQDRDSESLGNVRGILAAVLLSVVLFWLPALYLVMHRL